MCILFVFEGPVWLKNLYTVYLLVLRAISKAKPYWEKELFYTGDEVEDKIVKNLVMDIVKSIQYVFTFHPFSLLVYFMGFCHLYS